MLENGKKFAIWEIKKMTKIRKFDIQGDRLCKDYWPPGYDKNNKKSWKWELPRRVQKNRNQNNITEKESELAARL